MSDRYRRVGSGCGDGEGMGERSQLFLAPAGERRGGWPVASGPVSVQCAASALILFPALLRKRR